MCLEHTFTRNRFFSSSFFFFLPPTPTHLLGDQNRSSKVTLTSPLGLQADVSPPWDEAGGGPPHSRTAKHGVPWPIYDTFEGRLHCRHFRKQVAESLTCSMASCSHSRGYFELFIWPTNFFVINFNAIAMLYHIHSILYTSYISHTDHMTI